MSTTDELVERETLPAVQAPGTPTGTQMAVTPMDLLNLAVTKNADLAQLEKLMDLQDRYEKTEARKAFVSALNGFKANPPAIFKNKAVSYGVGKTGYKHATLDNVSGAIGEALAAVGISHRWETEQLEGGLIRVTCVLTHVLGHSERVPLQASPDTSGSKNAIQAVGSTVTYLQRYTLLSATGMAVQDQDDDGRQGKGNAMPETVKAGWLAAIDACADLAATEPLWAEVAKATTAAGDVSAHEALRAAMSAKRKALKTAPTKEEGVL